MVTCSAIVGSARPTVMLLFDERERRQYNTYYRPSGDEAAWFAKFHEIWDTGVVSRAIIGASFASPMLELIDARNMIVHLWSHSGGGKTAIMLFAASIWGDPDQNKNSFNSTQTARTEQFRHRTSFPAVFDELQSATDKELATTLYSLELGRGRMRANRVGGGVEDSTNEWKLSILTKRRGIDCLVVAIADLGGTEKTASLKLTRVRCLRMRPADSISGSPSDTMDGAVFGFSKRCPRIHRTPMSVKLSKRDSSISAAR